MTSGALSSGAGLIHLSPKSTPVIFRKHSQTLAYLAGGGLSGDGDGGCGSPAQESPPPPAPRPQRTGTPLSVLFFYVYLFRGLVYDPEHLMCGSGGQRVQPFYVISEDLAVTWRRKLIISWVLGFFT